MVGHATIQLYDRNTVSGVTKKATEESEVFKVVRFSCAVAHIEHDLIC